MPEKQDNPEAMHYPRVVSEGFNIQTITRDFSFIMSRMGIFEFILSIIPSRILTWE
jgi:hypothetical protein